MKKIILGFLVIAVSFFISGCISSTPTGVTGGLYTSADCKDKPNAVFDITRAAGYTTWHDKPYGVYLSRNLIETDLERNFKIEKWKGLWDMNHDGWKGELELEKIIHFSSDINIVKGTYTQQGKESVPLTGIIYDSSEHILHLSIKFSDTNNQSFTLHFHTLTKNMASGYTFWHGNRYGVMAFKG